MNKDTLKERVESIVYEIDEIALSKVTSVSGTLIQMWDRNVLTAYIEKKCESLIQQAKEEERQKILAFINSGYKSPASDTGWSIYLDDVEDFINQLSNTK